MSDIKLPYCPYCLNATVAPNLTPADDLSYMAIGYSIRKEIDPMMRTGAGKPTIIIFQGVPEKEAFYEPKYCPECGRKLTENARNEHENSYTGKNR